MKDKKWFQKILIFMFLICLSGRIGHSNLVLATQVAGESTNSTELESNQSDAVIQQGMIRGKVLLDNGSMVLTGIIIEDEQGNTYRTTTNSLAGYNLRLAPGNYTLYFTRGSEYSVVKEKVTVESYKVNYLQDVRLIHLFDTYARGWIGGDLHQHTFYSDGIDSVEELLFSNISCGLYYGFLSDHNTARGLAEWTQANRIVASIDSDGEERFFNAFDAVEVTTEFGHYQSLGVGLTFDTYEVLLRDLERSMNGEDKNEIIKEKIIYIAETIRREGGVPQINHPYSSNTMSFKYWEIAEHFDTIEIWNGVFNPGDGRYEPEKTSEQSQNYLSKLKWYELLNEVKNGGKFIAATGGTDNHGTASTYHNKEEITEIASIKDYNILYEKSGKYSGVPTTYANCRGEVNQENILTAFKEGHSFISNGVVVLADVNDATYGDTVTLKDETLYLNMEVYCREGLEGIQIIKNGNVDKEISLSSDITKYNEVVELEGILPGDWIVLEVFGTDCYYAITNPIFFK